MTKTKYNSIRARALKIFGIAMLVFSVLLLITGPYSALHEKKHCTEYVMGEVVSVNGESIKIYYTLPGESEGWLVTKQGTGLEKGDKVRVFYNPDDLSEKYIEGWEESVWSYLAIILPGAALGTGALLVARAAKKNDAVNSVLDVLDRDVR